MKLKGQPTPSLKDLNERIELNMELRRNGRTPNARLEALANIIRLQAERNFFYPASKIDVSQIIEDVVPAHMAKLNIRPTYVRPINFAA